MTETNYKDCNGEYISYGDILRCKSESFTEQFKHPYAIKEPFFMLCKFNNKPMIYIGGMDEYQDINEYKSTDDKIDELNVFEIFAHKMIYESEAKND